MTLAAVSHRSIGQVLLPITAAVMAGFLVVGVALPVLPLHVHDRLGFSTFMVGLVAGSQFAAALFSRVWAGSFADRYGAKRGVMVGLIGAAVSGLLYLLSLAFTRSPVVSITILLLGRALLGAAESFIITGGVSWGMSLVASAHAGKVIAWVGTAMFCALALGGPFGTMLFAAEGFVAVALLTTLLPLAVLMFLVRAPAVAPARSGQPSAFGAVAKAVWLPGLGAALSSIGYCAVLAFSSLHFAQQNWHPVWLAFSAFGAALIVARLILGHLPDQHGGARTALVFVAVQAAGLALIWLASTTVVATAGAALTGLGYSLVYPSLGVEAVRGVPAEHRGLAMGLYTAFLDVAMGLGSPGLGLVASISGLESVFLISAVVVLGTAGIAIQLQYRTAQAVR
jgi:MFS family permease